MWNSQQSVGRAPQQRTNQTPWAQSGASSTHGYNSSWGTGANAFRAGDGHAAPLNSSWHEHRDRFSNRHTPPAVFGGANEGDSILMVAEKPSVALAIAGALSGGRKRTRKTPGRGVAVHDFSGTFPPTGREAHFRVTSVVGHIFSVDFEDNSLRDVELFDAKIMKKQTEASMACRIIETLEYEARGCSHLVLWLDCDREGENIGFEVIEITRRSFPSDNQIFRARFSALTADSLHQAFNALQRPDANMSMAVDARQELDLKIGVTFTRFLTRSVRSIAQEKWEDQTLKTISYGPCQTPCLWFCVQRHLQILDFRSERFEELKPKIRCIPCGTVVSLQWKRKDGKATPAETSEHLRSLRSIRCSNIDESSRTLWPPVALNTVQMLKSASTGLGLSPQEAMKIAEGLYTSGYISYPRTESTRYPSTFRAEPVLHQHANHPDWGYIVSSLLQQHRHGISIPTNGVDQGDHPPITPCRYATSAMLSPAEFRVYDLVVRSFLGSLLPPARYRDITYSFDVCGEVFTARRYQIDDKGFLSALPWMGKIARITVSGTPDPPLQLRRGDYVDVVECECVVDWTKPPTYLTESNLIAEMDKNGIGTDASIPQHIQNVCDRRYVMVCGDQFGIGRAFGRVLDHKRMREPKPGEGRYMVPTEMGVALINAFFTSDSELVQPRVRAHIEAEVGKIAVGARHRDEVVRHNLELFKTKFIGFREKIDRVKEFFSRYSQYKDPAPRHRYAKMFLDKYYDELRGKKPDSTDSASGVQWSPSSRDLAVNGNGDSRGWLSARSHETSASHYNSTSQSTERGIHSYSAVQLQNRSVSTPSGSQQYQFLPPPPPPPIPRGPFRRPLDTDDGPSKRRKLDDLQFMQFQPPAPILLPPLHAQEPLVTKSLQVDEEVDVSGSEAGVEHAGASGNGKKKKKSKKKKKKTASAVPDLPAPATVPGAPASPMALQKNQSGTNVQSSNKAPQPKAHPLGLVVKKK
ncbi:putative uncharacterized protein LOC100215195 [Diplonema papillatum]|nr:putative uncharacterized protein LOC100215195 [Diplonema papillatum]